jgi:hypothetical protein
MMPVRFIIMHKTNPHWEAGAIPGPELIARVGAMVGDLAKAKVFQAGEGLRASSQGVRVRTSGKKLAVTAGPFEPGNELPAGFTILRAESVDEVIDWASRQAAALGDTEIDIRPVTEPWDIGMSAKPPNVTAKRYMALRKATAASEAGSPLTPEQQAGMTRLIDAAKRAGSHLATETMLPSDRGLRDRLGGLAGRSVPMGEALHRHGGGRRGGRARAGVLARFPSSVPEAARRRDGALRDLESSPARFRRPP